MSEEKQVYVELQRFLDKLLDEASQEKPIPDALYMSNLARRLAQIVPLIHGGNVGGVDIIHCRWAEALRDALYLGCLTQQKSVREEYRGFDTIRDLMKKTIDGAFMMGVDYAPQRERNSKKPKDPPSTGASTTIFLPFKKRSSSHIRKEKQTGRIGRSPINWGEIRFLDMMNVRRIFLP